MKSSEPQEIINIGPALRLLLQTRRLQILLDPSVAQTVRPEPDSIAVFYNGTAPHSQIEITPLGAMDPNLMRGRHKNAILHVINQNRTEHRTCVDAAVPQPVDEESVDCSSQMHSARIEI